MLDKNYSEDLVVAANQNRVEREYWLDRLAGDLDLVRFPADDETVEIEGEVDSFQRFPFQFTGELAGRALKISKQSDLALNIIFLAGVTALLNKYTGSTDIILGAPTYKQKREGAFINTVLALRFRLEEGYSFKQLLGLVKQTVTEADKNQNYPFPVLRKQLSPENAPVPIKLFDIAVLLDTIHERDYLRDIEPSMILTFNRSGDQLGCTIEYDGARYNERGIQRIERHLTTLLQAALTNPDELLSDLDILTEDERKLVLETFNDTGERLPSDMTIQRLFSLQAERTPDQVALDGVTSDGDFWFFPRCR